MRRFIRHPADIPIQVSTAEAGLDTVLHSHNVSCGGLAFASPQEIQPGSVVKVRIAAVDPAFESHARVAWCDSCGDRFDLGVEFLDAEDAFRVRMVEQVCHIEEYRHTVLRSEGRELTPEEAAQEWIAKHAAGFPGSGTNGLH